MVIRHYEESIQFALFCSKLCCLEVVFYMFYSGFVTFWGVCLQMSYEKTGTIKTYCLDHDYELP